MPDRRDRHSSRGAGRRDDEWRGDGRGAEPNHQRRGALAAVGVGTVALLGGWLALRDGSDLPAALRSVLTTSTVPAPALVSSSAPDAATDVAVQGSGDPADGGDTGDTGDASPDATAPQTTSNPEDTWPSITDPPTAATLLPEAPPRRTRVAALPGVPAVDAKAYVVYDGKRNRIIATNNADARLAVGSIMKLLTARVTLQSGPLSDVVEIPKFQMFPGESKIGLTRGDRLTREYLLNALLIFSANDAAKSLAINIGGSEKAFADKMNAAAATLRLKNTVAKNPTGLDTAGQFSSANDVLTMARDLMRADVVRAIAAKPSVRYQARNYKTTNDLLGRYPGTDGLKTGHTTQAGYCMVASATRDGRQIIVVVLGASSDQARARSARTLLDWAFKT